MTNLKTHTRAIIFDMDGVLVDSEPLHELAFLEVFAEMGYAERHGIDFTRYYGKSDRALWLDFIARHRPPQQMEELLEWKQDRFVEILRERQPIFEPIPELLARLSERYALAVASGSNHQVIDQVLALGQLRRWFPVVVSVEDVRRGKPAPDVFLRAAERLEVSPADCIVIEDSSAGVEAAHAAGMRVIAITNSLPRAQLAQADEVVETYAEIESMLL